MAVSQINLAPEAQVEYSIRMTEAQLATLVRGLEHSEVDADRGDLASRIARISRTLAPYVDGVPA